ncbi:MAG: GNAT family N-acetyltransferase [Candidatus Woesebacteria bacterium]|nr:MAG: GNAT family N-acetyltransferase [Candidatus Woesebacteria bacterium]
MKENQQIVKEIEFVEYDENKMVAAVVSRWTKEAGTMLPKEPEEILFLLENSVSVVAWEYGRTPKPIGFGAVTFEWSDNWIELGAIVVGTSHREMGLGHAIVGKLIEAAKSKHPKANLFALCNEKSLKIFLDHGGEVITKPGILPDEVFGECINCPKFDQAKWQNKLCCDIPVKIK